jgi:lipopolysaccharide export system protein LptA
MPREDNAPKEEVRPGLETNRGEATRRAEGTRERAWTVTWEHAILETGENGRPYGTMNGVRGTIYSDDQPTSDFSAERAISKENSDVLTLEGNVAVIARKPKGKLTCERLEWYGEADLAVAKGNVRVTSEGFTLEDAPEMWAASDLSRVGTPDLYVTRNKMDVRKLAIPIAAMAALGAAQGRRITLGTGEERFEITNLQSGYTELVGPGKYSFLGKGNPLNGLWMSQKITFKTQQIEGTASEVASGQVLVDTAKMTGSVRIVAKRPSRGGGGEQEVTLESSTLSYTRSNERMTLTGATTLTQNDPGVSQSLKLTGSGGWVSLYGPGQAPEARRAIRDAVLEGPVTFQIRGSREVPIAGQAGKTQRKPYTVDGKGSRLVYDDGNRSMTLTGNVEIDARDAPWIGEIRTSKVTLKLDDRGNPVRVEFEEPGTTSVDQPPPRRRSR